MRSSFVILLFLAGLLFGAASSWAQLPDERTRDVQESRWARSKSVARVSGSVTPGLPGVNANDFTFTRIVGSGDPMPGVEGQTFTWVNGNFFKGLTRMNAEGHVGFTGGWTTSFFPAALYVYHDGVNDLVVRTGDPAAGTSSQFQGFPIPFTVAPHLGRSDVSFDGSADLFGDLDGAWVSRSGEIEKVFVKYDEPPDTPDGTHFFQWFHAMSRSGAVIVNSNFIPPGGTSFNNQGFFRDTGSGLEVVAKTGVAAPGFPTGAVFGDGPHVSLIPFERWTYNDEGWIAFNARARGAGFDAVADEGIWRETAAGLELVVREGYPVPGAPGAVFRAGAYGFRTFGDSGLLGVFINNAGQVLFGANMARDGEYAGTGMFTTRSGTPELVLFANLQSESPPGDQAPGFDPGQTFSRFTHAVHNDHGTIAFGARVNIGISNFSTSAGLWVEDAGGFRLVGRPRDPAPLLSGWQYANAELGIMEFTNSGALYYLARATDGVRTESVLYMLDADGVYHLVLMTGELLDEGVAPKVVNSFVVGFDHSDRDEIAVHVVYDDDSEELFLIGPAQTLVVSLDVKPGSCPNPLNLRAAGDAGDNPKKGGVLPVAVLGTADFDVRNVDVAALRLEGVEPLRYAYEDVATPAGGGDCDCTDRGPDGHEDLTLKFRKSEIASALAAGGEERELTLTGRLLDGTAIEASDCVQLEANGGPVAAAEAHGLEVEGAVPNPFNPVTSIRYRLSAETRVTVEIYDVAGRLVTRLVDRVQSAGDHAVEWNATGKASGTYFYRLAAGGVTETRKLVLLK